MPFTDDTLTDDAFTKENPAGDAFTKETLTNGTSTKENPADLAPTAGIDPRERVIVALDLPLGEALAVADALAGHARWVKVGMTTFYAAGPSAVAAFKQRGFKVFVDLKLHDIPHQVEGAAMAVALTGADMMTIHASGGAEMMEAAVRGARAAADEAGSVAPLVLAVTVLTSMDDAALRSIGVGCDPAQQVRRLAELAKRSGVGGCVASPMESAMLREVLGPGMAIVTPGVRPAGSDAADQKRVATPAQAFANGSTHVVIGRPIAQAPDPAQAFERIIDEIS